MLRLARPTSGLGAGQQDGALRKSYLAQARSDALFAVSEGNVEGVDDAEIVSYPVLVRPRRISRNEEHVSCWCGRAGNYGCKCSVAKLVLRSLDSNS